MYRKRAAKNSPSRLLAAESSARIPAIPVLLSFTSQSTEVECGASSSFCKTNISHTTVQQQIVVDATAKKWNVNCYCKSYQVSGIKFCGDDCGVVASFRRLFKRDAQSKVTGESKICGCVLLRRAGLLHRQQARLSRGYRDRKSSEK